MQSVCFQLPVIPLATAIFLPTVTHQLPTAIGHPSPAIHHLWRIPLIHPINLYRAVVNAQGEPNVPRVFKVALLPPVGHEQERIVFAVNR
jgi:hypothetical protein